MPRIPESIVLIAPVTDTSGIAEAARNLYFHLFDLGVKVKLVELPFWSHLKVDLNPEDKEILELGLNRNDIQNPAVIHFYPPHALHGNGLPVVQNAKVNISYTLFETDRCPLFWKDMLNDQFFSELWVPYKFNLKAYADTGIIKEKLKVMPLGVDTNKYNPNVTPMTINHVKPFVFMNVLDWSTRKNPEAMVAAFLQEFNNVDDACFVIKSYTGAADENSRRIITGSINKLRTIYKSNASILFIPDFIKSDLMPSLHKAANCWVNLSRGEGHDMGALQSLACGVPVIGSDNTAHQEYLNNQNGYLVPCNKIPINDQNFLVRNPQFLGHSWFEPDIKQARNKMRQAYSDWKNGTLEAKGKIARESVLKYSWNTSAIKIVNTLSKYY